jgi:hypothetical protein
MKKAPKNYLKTKKF